MEKEFKLKAEQIKEILEWNGADGCIATDKITVEGSKVGYMYREEPSNGYDSGWRFFEGSESDEYLDDANNSAVYKLNTICNYDTEIIPFLNAPYGTAYGRNEKGEFVEEILNIPEE